MGSNRQPTAQRANAPPLRFDPALTPTQEIERQDTISGRYIRSMSEMRGEFKTWQFLNLGSVFVVIFKYIYIYIYVLYEKSGVYPTQKNKQKTCHQNILFTSLM